LEMPTTTVRQVIEQSTPTALIDLAESLVDNGVQLFGAHWCPYCQAQKQEFGSASYLLPCIEVADPDGTTSEIDK
jgi:thiol-disulfide isomerase/thioredoxin